MGIKLEVGDKKLMGQFETLCAFHTPIDCIASEFGVCNDTLKYWVLRTYGEEFRIVYQRFMNKGNSILNKSALKMAEKNPMMNIWLRKQWLGERDPDKQTEVKTTEIEDWTPIAEMLKDGNK